MCCKKSRKQIFTILIFVFISGNFSLCLTQTYSDYRVEGQSTLEPEKETNKDVMLLIQKARELYKAGIYQSAILSYQNAIKLDPKTEIARLELGKIALETKNWAYAIRMLSELAALRPNDLETRRVLMEIYYTYEEPLLEMKTAYELLALSPSDTALLRRIANLYQMHEMHDEEIKILEQSSQLAPRKPEILEKLASLYTLRKNEKKEVETYERLLKLQPDNTMIMKRLARLYSTFGNTEQQIVYYQRVLALEQDNGAVEKALILAYGDALGSRDLAFDLKQARQHCAHYLSNAQDTLRIKEISDAVSLAASPMVVFTVNNHQYDFTGKMNHLENLVTATFPGLISGAWLVVKNSFILVEAPHEPPQLQNFQLQKMKLARLYRGQLIWQQKFQKLRLNLGVGALKMVSGSAGISDYKPKFISTFIVNYHLNLKLSFSAGYDLSSITLTPRAIAQNIQRHQFGAGFLYTPLEKIQCQAQFQALSFSDDNQGQTATIELEYNILRTLTKTKNIEAEEPIGFDNTGTQISLGLGYEYLNFEKERNIYPTAINEHIFNLALAAEHQLWPSIFLKAEGFTGVDNKDQTIWGYHLALEKQLNWRINFVIGYENFRSPYVYENQEFINQESRMYLGISSTF